MLGRLALQPISGCRRESSRVISCPHSPLRALPTQISMRLPHEGGFLFPGRALPIVRRRAVLRGRMGLFGGRVACQGVLPRRPVLDIPRRRRGAFGWRVADGKANGNAAQAAGGTRVARGARLAGRARPIRHQPNTRSGRLRRHNRRPGCHAHLLARSQTWGPFCRV